MVVSRKVASIPDDPYLVGQEREEGTPDARKYVGRKLHCPGS